MAGKNTNQQWRIIDSNPELHALFHAYVDVGNQILNDDALKGVPPVETIVETIYEGPIGWMKQGPYLCGYNNSGFTGDYRAANY